MKEILVYLDSEINLSDEKSAIMSIRNIINYFDSLSIQYDLETLTNILTKSKKLTDLIKYISENNITIFDDCYPIDDFLLIYEINHNRKFALSWSENTKDEELNSTKLYLDQLPKRLTEEQEKILNYEFEVKIKDSSIINDVFNLLIFFQKMKKDYI